MKRFLLLALTLLTISASAFAKTWAMVLKSQYFTQTPAEEKIDNVAFYGPTYISEDEKTKVWIPDYYVDLAKETQIQFNNPYLIEANYDCMDQILYFKANGKYYVGSYSLLIDNHYSHPLVSFEFDTFEKAIETIFLWSYLYLVQSRDCDALHFIPSDRDFWWDEESGFDLELPKDMIDANYRLYKERGYSTAFVNEQLLMDDKWHDLSNGKIYKRKSDVYSCKNGKLYCNGNLVQYLEGDINKMLHVCVVHNSEKFYQLLKSSAGYYYCERCANTIYGGGHRPIEMYGYHYQDITDRTTWKQKAASWRPVKETVPQVIVDMYAK